MNNSMHHLPEVSDAGVNLAFYVKGFVDAIFGREYNDGVYPRHNMIVCVPPKSDEIGAPAAAYRAGRLAGMAAKN